MTLVFYISISNAEGKLENKSYSNLPELFFEPNHGQIFVHDATYGDLDGDGDLDIFRIPISDYTKTGYKFGRSSMLRLLRKYTSQCSSMMVKEILKLTT